MDGHISRPITDKQHHSATTNIKRKINERFNNKAFIQKKVSMDKVIKNICKALTSTSGGCFKHYSLNQQHANEVLIPLIFNFRVPGNIKDFGYFSNIL